MAINKAPSGKGVSAIASDTGDDDGEEVAADEADGRAFTTDYAGPLDEALVEILTPPSEETLTAISEARDLDSRTGPSEKRYGGTLHCSASG